MPSYSKNNMYPLLIFLVLTVFFTIAFGILFSFVFGDNIVMFLTNMDPAKEKDKIAHMANAGGMIFGYSLAFAGAATTIFLAYLGYRLVITQRTEYLIDKYEKVEADYSRAIAALLYAFVAYEHISRLEPWDCAPETGENINLRREDANVAELKKAHEYLIDSCLNFVDAVEQLGLNPLAQVLLRKFSGRLEEINTKFREFIKDVNPLLPGFSILPTTIFELVSLMRNRLLLLREKDPLHVAEARNMSFGSLSLYNLQQLCRSDPDEHPKEESESEKARVIYYREKMWPLGYYLAFSLLRIPAHYEKISDDKYYDAFIGVAFLHDFSSLLPSKEKWRDVLKERFPSHAGCVDEISIDFDPNQAFPSGFLSAVDKIGPVILEAEGNNDSRPLWDTWNPKPKQSAAHTGCGGSNQKALKIGGRPTVPK